MLSASVRLNRECYCKLLVVDFCMLRKTFFVIDMEF